MSKAQRETSLKSHKRIFYTNITYGCNSSCVFCYSHNTKHTRNTYDEIPKDSLVEYWDRMYVSENDRIIINGGEPLLHTEFNEIITAAHKYGCEILIYTNGRLLNTLETTMLDEHCRFVVPMHGHEKLHDEITRVQGSYRETMEGIRHISESGCLVDLKVIINYSMAINQDDYIRTEEALIQLPDINAVHITKMADTIISQRNKCPSVTPDMSSSCTKKLYDLFRDKCIVKIFDTCIGEIVEATSFELSEMDQIISVYFKDAQHEFDVDLEKPYLNCMETCDFKNICQSAVGEYTVLEIKKGRFSVGLE